MDRRTFFSSTLSSAAGVMPAAVFSSARLPIRKGILLGMLPTSMSHTERFKLALDRGYAEEHARDILPGYALRQHFVVSFNLRSLLHFTDLRAKKDAQLEIQQLCDLLWVHAKEWTPAVAEWYEKNRLHKARLAP